MARPVNPNKTTVSVKLSPAEREALENYRWDNRMEVSDVLRAAITEFFTAKGVKVTESASEGDTAEAEKPVEKPVTRR